MISMTGFQFLGIWVKNFGLGISKIGFLTFLVVLEPLKPEFDSDFLSDLYMYKLFKARLKLEKFSVKEIILVMRKKLQF